MSIDSTISLKRFWSLLKLVMGADLRRYLAWNAVLTLIQAYVLIPPLIVGALVDILTHFQSSDSWYPIYFYSAGLGALTIAVALIRLHSKAKLNDLAIIAAYRARVYGFERLMNQTVHWHEEESTGNKVQRVTTGSTNLEEFLRLLSGDLLNVAVIVVAVVSAFFVKNFLFGLIGLTHVLLFLGIQIYFTNRVKEIIDNSNQATENAAGLYVEGAANILTIKTLNLQKGITERVAAKEDVAKELKIRIARSIFWKWRCFQTLQGCILGLFIYIVARDVTQGGSSAGDLLVLFTYFRSLHEGLGDSTSMLDNVVKQVISLGRLAPIFEDGVIATPGIRPFPADWATIELRGVTAHYQSDRGGLNNFSLTIRKGEHIGVVGSSGAGKSTLAKVLMGVQPIQNGSYVISGVPYHDIAPTEASNAMSMVLQDSELFNASLAENIAAMRNVSDDHIHDAIRMAGLNQVVEKLDDGISTIIGEKGYRLSGGERQRLGIARAICKNPQILVLDEATSALDGETEARIHESLLAELGDKTLVIIAHRLSTVRNLDKIVVVENGTIVEEGAPDDLLSDPASRFAQMWALQEK